MSLLQGKNLQVSIGDTTVCRGLDITIRPGQCWGLLGVNGAGKTTLLHTLAGIRPADQGEILLYGQRLDSLSRRHIARTLGLLFQDNDNPFSTTVEETVLCGRHPHLSHWGWESDQDIDIAHRALHSLGLGSFLSRRTDTLSGGEYRRVAIATLLTQQPQILLLDEPTNHLDLNQQLAVLKLLSNLKEQGCGLLMSLHDINLALRFCDYLLLLKKDGHESGPVAELGTAERLGRLYEQPLEALNGPHGPVMVPR